MMKHFDLFSGIGGFALAARWAGFETVAFCETDPFCRKILKKHWPNVLKYRDIKDIANPDQVDLITAGFPCQPFSIAGKRKGKEDDRYLWPQVIRLLKKTKPTWFIGENVTGIVAMELDNILSDLEREDYQTTTFIIPACAANAPHRRDRLWIIAHYNSERCNVWSSTGKEGHIPDNFKWHTASLQSEWEKLKPISWQTNTAENWFTINTEISRDHDGISNRLDRIKALGNAIVPQVAYPILKTIYEIEKLKNE